MVKSSLALRCSTEQNALHTLIHQRHLTPSCGGHASTAKRTLDPARTIRGELDPRPGIREQPGSGREELVTSVSRPPPHWLAPNLDLSRTRLTMRHEQARVPSDDDPLLNEVAVLTMKVATPLIWHDVRKSCPKRLLGGTCFVLRFDGGLVGSV